MLSWWQEVYRQQFFSRVLHAARSRLREASNPSLFGWAALGPPRFIPENGRADLQAVGLTGAFVNVLQKPTGKAGWSPLRIA